MIVHKRSRATPLTAELLSPRRNRTAQFALAAGTTPRDYEAELREREALHRLACEAGRAGSWYVRLDNGQCTLSPMAAALFGLPAQEIVLPPEIWRKRIDPTHLPGLEGTVRSAAQDDGRFEFEFKATRAGGDEHWLYIRGALLRDAAGRPARVHGAVVDVTAHKSAQEELRALNETLEQRVAERTEQLIRTQEALRQSQKLEAMGQLTGGIAHDFNNLLTPIIANLDLLQRRCASLRDKRLIDGALRSADSAQILVQRLLAFARRQALQPSAVDLRSLIEGMADLIGRTIGPRIRIRLELAEDLRTAHADPNQLEMAILNLSVNARDAMPEGGTLTIRAEDAEVAEDAGLPIAPGSYLRLAVADTGVGMDETTCARAVEPFFSTKGIGKGTGLGLSMVDGLASQMGGAFRLTSEIGRGTCATLWLPAWSGEQEDVKVSPEIEVAPRATGIVLVVDDHDLVRTSTAELLRELGFEAIEARSGEDAAQMIHGGLHVDLVVTDHLMPGMSGVDLARFIEAHRPGTPTLLVSGYSDPAGIPSDIPCLTKPFRKAQLEEQIARLAAPAKLEPDPSAHQDRH